MTAETSLYVPADAQGLAKLKTEWLAARVVFVVGFVVAIAFAVWWSYGSGPAMVAGADDASVASEVDTGQMDDAISSGQTSKEGFALCRLAIGTAQAFGVTPNTMRYTAGPGKTDIQGRYTCVGEDKAAVHYTMVLDLVCKDLGNPQCINLVTITKPDGSVVFKRQDDSAGNLPMDEAPAATDETAAPTDGSEVPPATDGTTMDATGGAQTDGTAPPQ